MPCRILVVGTASAWLWVFSPSGGQQLLQQRTDSSTATRASRLQQPAAHQDSASAAAMEKGLKRCGARTPHGERSQFPFLALPPLYRSRTPPSFFSSRNCRRMAQRMENDPSNKRFTSLSMMPFDNEEHLTYMYAGWAGQFREYGVTPSVLRRCSPSSRRARPFSVRTKLINKKDQLQVRFNVPDDQAQDARAVAFFQGMLPLQHDDLFPRLLDVHYTIARSGRSTSASFASRGAMRAVSEREQAHTHARARTHGLSSARTRARAHAHPFSFVSVVCLSVCAASPTRSASPVSPIYSTGVLSPASGRRPTEPSSGTTAQSTLCSAPGPMRRTASSSRAVKNWYCLTSTRSTSNSARVWRLGGRAWRGCNARRAANGGEIAE